MNNSEVDVDSLLERIELMREKLVDIGLREGLTAPSTLKYSELLDEQIKIYQKLIK
ncbi:aspartyl-phosphate phosphatase Spo0E family protein [Gracilibacillus suaedae]|uniref:aspartyl-phosphate phosphatase Spo0E family protein n=1 Tax=Gracilibacillus suaedae TaxID=2820273 RepID=UPI001ABE97E5|nr:aspartyl-phosphate phosphatase Spo0E family protein [Gracilibacillus suaedae]